MSKLSITDVASLPGGDKIPRLGLGVFMAKGQKCTNAIVSAIKAGYRHVDSAQYYDNEAETGRGVRDSGLPRNEIFVTTKRMYPESDVEAEYRAVKAGVERTGLDYVDLFLVHTPGSGSKGRRILWAALERLHMEGKAKNIGVSNYGVHHLKEMKDYAKVYPPAVNQIELHPWFQQKDIVDYCNQEDIVVQAYCPLVRQQKSNDKTLLEIAKNYDKSPNQILVRWSLQKGFVPLPKSENPQRIAENADIFDFDISNEDMDKLNSLDQGKNG